ncbi:MULTISPECIES: alpha-xenorhabdolysin family binary toxin subunit B [Pseudomonas]|uniref:alpha-xenorhabdolysin family binary toxin subunit B n=1 Tax=Pseudomonas TaxID=286 RepID=UPI001E429451|nr:MULTISPECIES: alpha-xenorhabdolysin family binary toxin subunit B [Pseudomonas]MCE1116489.1 alpha-xenorhabdolysin family binary toxin subunit B [Pseudomonas sp. NMI795_08]
MNDNVTYLQPSDAPQMEPILAANRAFTTAWQQGALKFAPVLQEGLERHMKLFDNCRRQLAGNAQRLVAELAGDPLADILDALGDDDGGELIGLAGETRDAVATLLGRLLAHLASERQALAALPALDGQGDQQRLLKQQQATSGTERQLTEEHGREAAKVESVLKAIATLEANGLQTRFGGVVPSLTDLQKLAAPGGEALVTAEVVTQAVEQLKVLLGDLIEGMRYEQLQRERRALQERLNGLARKLRELARARAELRSNLAALDDLPRLLELRAQWDSAINVLRLSLQARQTQIASHAMATASDVTSVVQAFAALLGFLRSLLEQDRRAF